jgi:hypothetical protein
MKRSVFMDVSYAPWVARGLLKMTYKVCRFSRYERHSLTVVTTIKPIAHRSITASVWYRNCS